MSDPFGLEGQGSSKNEVSALRDRLEELERTVEVYEAIFDAIPDALRLIDTEGRVVRSNDAGARLVGMDTQDVAGHKCHELFGLSESCSHCPIEKVRQSGKAAKSELFVEELDRWFRVRAYPVVDSEGRIDGVIEHLRDITEAQRAQSLELRHGLDMAFLAKSAMAFIKFPADGNIHRFIADKIGVLLGEETYIVVSEYLAEQQVFRPRALVGFEEEWQRIIEFVGKDPMQIIGDIPVNLREKMLTGKLTHVEGGLEELAQHVLPTPTLSMIVTLLGVGNVYITGLIHGEQIFGCVCIITRLDHEVTRKDMLEAFIGQAVVAIARRQAQQQSAELEAQLFQAQKMEAVGRLAGGVAHDFNNLLTGITGNVAFALMELAEDDPVREYILEIEESSERAAEIIRRLLSFSRRQVIKPRPLDLNDVLIRMRKMLVRLIGEDVSLETELAGGLPLVMIDPGQVEQTIVNLAINARDAMPNGGCLSLRTEAVVLDEKDCSSVYGAGARPGRYVLLEVVDTGQGMDKETRLRVFEPFFTTKPEGRGTGLGLATVYGAMRQCHGHIRLTSERGIGTCFFLYFPATDAPAEAQPVPARVSEIPRGTETILVVEDERAVRRLVVRLLGRYGYSILEAPSGEEGLSVGRSYKKTIHLLLTDVIMPKMKGPELAQLLLQHRPEMKVLYTSGYTDSHIVSHGILEEGVSFIAKPFTAASLCRKVREVLDERE